MPSLRPIEIVLILVVILLLFGARRLPDAARGIGRSLRIFKSEVKGLHDDDAPATASRTTASGPTRPTAGPASLPPIEADAPELTPVNTAETLPCTAEGRPAARPVGEGSTSP